MDDETEIVQSPLNEVVLYLAKNAKYLTPEAQSVIVRYLDVQTTPIMTVGKQHYSRTNNKGVRYHLNKKDVTLRGGKEQAIYYFTTDIRPEATTLPDGYEVHENPRNGFLTVRRAGAEGDCEDD